MGSRRWMQAGGEQMLDASPDGTRTSNSGRPPNAGARRNGGLPMKSLVLKVRRFLVSEDGPTAVEYAVMLSLIVIVCLTAITSIDTKASSTFSSVSSSLN